MNGNFSKAEILSLIEEVGDPLELCVPATTQMAQPVYGIPAKTALQCRPVRGYVTSERREFALASSPPAVSGALVAYLSPVDATREELNNAQARIRYQGKDYQFEYVRGHRDRGVVRLHQLRLRSANAL